MPQLVQQRDRRDAATLDRQYDWQEILPVRREQFSVNDLGGL